MTQCFCYAFIKLTVQYVMANTTTLLRDFSHPVEQWWSHCPHSILSIKLQSFHDILGISHSWNSQNNLFFASAIKLYRRLFVRMMIRSARLPLGFTSCIIENIVPRVTWCHLVPCSGALRSPKRLYYLCPRFIGKVHRAESIVNFQCQS